jgi:hypothetical protein
MASDAELVIAAKQREGWHAWVTLPLIVVCS